MDAEHPKSLPKIRTFARDQAHVQHHDEPAVVLPQKEAPITATQVKTTDKQPAVVQTAHITVPTKKEHQPVPPVPPVTHIPAFHELKKRNVHEMVKPAPLQAPAKHTAPVPKKVTVTARKFEPVKTTSGGTIITDNKKGEFKVLPSLFASLKTWLKELFGGSDKAPKYTITATDRRKGVIQKATSNNATIFTADNDTLKEEIRRRQQRIEASDKGEILWTPNTEVGVPLLEKTTRHNVPTMPVTISFKKQAGYLPPPVITEPQTMAVPAPAPRVFVPPPEITNFGAEQNPPALPRIRITEALHNTTPVTPLTIPVIAPVVVPVVQPPIEKAPELRHSIPHTPNPRTSHLKNGLRTLATFNTNLTAIIFAGSIVSLVLLVLIVRTFLGLISPETTTPDGDQFVPTLSTSGQAQELAISSPTKEALYAAFAAKPVPATGVTEFRVVTADGIVLPVQEVLSLLNFNTNQNLNQSVTAVHLAYASSKRAIILEVTDPTTVFGALLGWEKTMADDLAAVLSTGDATSDSFTDKTIGQTDVRILSDNGTPILVYGFIGKNTVVLTQDLTAFTSLLPREE
jgi:hypothetical protein